MILYERTFKRQWDRGKLSRKTKKRMSKEMGFRAIPSEFAYIRKIQYRGLCAGHAGTLFAQSLCKAFQPFLESVRDMRSITKKSISAL